MNRLFYRIAGNALSGFGVGYVSGSFVNGALQVGIIAGLLHAAAAAAKELREYGNYEAPEDKRKQSKLRNLTLF